MKLFDVKYLHDSADECCVTIGSNVFFADSLKDIVSDVRVGAGRATLTGIYHASSPFEVRASRWRYIYYDPNYDVKFAFARGEPIEYRSDGAWRSWYMSEEPQWDDYKQWRVATNVNAIRFKLGDVVRTVSDGYIGIVTMIDPNDNPPSYSVGGTWYDADELMSVDTGNDSPLGCSCIKGEVTARADDKENE